jgi:2-oxoglutarate ferredoxin oxidoreductase subunit alpha
MQRLLRKFETAKTLVPKPLLLPAPRPARFGAIFYGSTSPAMAEALDLLASRGILVNALRIRGFPFAEEIVDFCNSHPWVFVVEQNRDAQLKTLLVNEANVNQNRLVPVLHYDGTPITARYIADEIARHAAAHTVVPFKKVVS